MRLRWHVQAESPLEPEQLLQRIQERVGFRWRYLLPWTDWFYTSGRVKGERITLFRLAAYWSRFPVIFEGHVEARGSTGSQVVGRFRYSYFAFFMIAVFFMFGFLGVYDIVLCSTRGVHCQLEPSSLLFPLPTSALLVAYTWWAGRRDRPRIMEFLRDVTEGDVGYVP